MSIWSLCYYNSTNYFYSSSFFIYSKIFNKNNTFIISCSIIYEYECKTVNIPEYLFTFDTNEEARTTESDDIHKKEPYLNYSSEETNEKIDLNNEFNQDTSDEKDQYEDKMPEEGKEEANKQEDELLDIPTFLRRQAN